jgi:pyruvate formate-lyase activating enzyme-like uncharacterized protein
MIHSIPDKNYFIALNQAEYDSVYHTLRFSQDYQLFTAKRNQLLSRLQPYANWTANHTKPFLGELSPGCRLCTQGNWSCLFINNRCNAKCFYCPTSQDKEDVPATNTMLFPRTTDYGDYVEAFGFDGCSISGGEPLLSFEKSLSFIKEIRNRKGRTAYIWLYTNGILSDDHKLQRLAEAGLDEIRFDLSAVNYQTQKIIPAIGVIPQVSVEIPAIPEDIDKIKQSFTELAGQGVNYFNLHQLRCTPYNREKLILRHYTFLHGEKVTVCESEQTALELMHYFSGSQIPVNINYCSFIYKNSFQHAFARKRAAAYVVKPWEMLLPTGFIRYLSVISDLEFSADYIEAIKKDPQISENICLSPDKKRLFLPLIPEHMVFPADCKVEINYLKPFMCHRPTYCHAFVKVNLPHGADVYFEKQPVFQHLLNSSQTFLFRQLFQHPHDQMVPCEDDLLNSLIKFETLPAGLAEYF